jgi:mannitol-specific phosphotransferase system IIBC component
MANSINSSEINTVIFACEAGMGSSLMSVNSLKKKLKKANIQGVTVVHKPAREIPGDAKLVVVHEGLAKVAKTKAPGAVVLAFKHFLNDPVFDQLVTAFAGGADLTSNVE